MFDRCNGQGMDSMGHAPKTAASLHELRSRIERGRYEIKPDRVAEAMLRRGIRFGPRRPAARRD
ncbi:MAG: flagellar biosynthesis anti-sigma factor FlgM [Thermoleophilaceae bacterium]